MRDRMPPVCACGSVRDRMATFSIPLGQVCMQRREFVKSAIVLGGAMAWSPAKALSLEQEMPPVEPDPQVKRVLVMFKCHFDAGFIDTQKNVVNRYFTEYFPQAIRTAAEQRQSGDHRYVWTTGSWLLYEYLEQASAADRNRMEQAIAAGDIAWHALPFSWQTEMLDASMIEGSIALSQSLDRRFGHTSTGAKMTDVPGHTRGIIAPLAAQGVTFLDIGVNDASTPAELPPLFLWRSPGAASLAVMYHHGYGGVTRVPGSDVAIAVVVRDDNSGPHLPKEIADIYADLSRRFPQAQIEACGLTEIANAVTPHRGALPVITGEIGDSWIHGIASDPLKVARYREVGRLRQAWIRQGAFLVGDATDLALLRHLLLEPEHTWGTDTKTWLDFDHYTPQDLTPMLDTKNYKVVEFSWEEKRQDLFEGIAALPEPLRHQAEEAVGALAAKEPQMPSASASAGREIETAHFVLKIDAKTGAIVRLQDKKSGKEWASPDHPLALFSYQTLSQEDYSRFFANYVISTADWAKKDFGKPNIERFGAKSREWVPSLKALQVEKEQHGHHVLARLEIDDAEAQRSGRSAFPKKMYLELLLPDAEPAVHLNFYWFEKPATRMPEALWLSFHPAVADSQGWRMEKSGEQVSPFDVVAGGSRHLHAVSTGFRHSSAGQTLQVETIDGPLIAVGEKSPLNFSKAQPDLAAGVHSCLFNNAWGTNYLMWFGEDMRFRYVLRGDSA
jgi:hypothetical protein